MNFNLNDEQNMFVESAARYVRERSNIEDKRQTAASEAGFSKTHWAQFAEMGWLALNLPERVDGMACGMTDLALVMEQIGKGAFHEPLIDTPILCGTLLSSVENNDHSDSILAGIATGEQIVALAHVEYDGRCEWTTEVKTQAKASDAGWLLSGEKQRSFYAPQANHFIVSAECNGETAFFLVDANSEGISMDTYQMIDGSHAADISFKHVAVATDNKLLSGEAAQHALSLALDKSVLADCARALGSMEIVMAMTADYIKTRVQYGKPLSQFQSLQHRMSEMLVEYEQAQSIFYRALSLFDNEAERGPAISAAKVLISKAGQWVVGQGIQLHGGIGVTEEFAVGHHYKAMLTLEQRFGNSDWHLDRCDSIIDSH